MTSSDRVAVITGGTRGVGLHTAGRLAASGWRIAMCSRRADEARRAAADLVTGHGVVAFGDACDVTAPGAVRSFAAAVTDRLGPPTAVLANAAVLGPVGRLTDVDLDEWARAVAVDLCGVANTISAFGAVMAHHGGGSIVAMSGGGIGGPSVPDRLSAYTSSKAAIAALVETVAVELQACGVRVNTLAPGAVPTTFMDPLIDAGPEAAGAEHHRQVLDRRGEQADLDGFDRMLAFLFDPDAPPITGRVLSARWESPECLAAGWADLSASRYRLRRIDDNLYREGPPSA